MKVYILVEHICEADRVIGVFADELSARIAMKAAHEKEPLEWCSIELWEIGGACISDNVANC